LLGSRPSWLGLGLGSGVGLGLDHLARLAPLLVGKQDGRGLGLGFGFGFGLGLGLRLGLGLGLGLTWSGRRTGEKNGMITATNPSVGSEL